jgi:dTDP-4-dehydrorhamnose reductase
MSLTQLGAGNWTLLRKSRLSVLGGLDYDYLFLAGALTGVDYCERHETEAHAVNAVGPKRIAEISASKGAHVT